MDIARRYGVGGRITALLVAAVALGAPQTASADIQHLDDVIIAFSLCVGNDCVNGENFGFDTLRLKENNVRMHFDDTSTSASFPRNDWRFIANDSSNGGDSYMAIEDSTAGRQVFRVDAGAPANSLRVDSSGDVGIGTSNPVVNAHIVTGNTPTLRLEQDGSSGFTAQTWDLAGNEANFFIRDATNGSQLPFRIKPGADSDAIFVDADNDIGFGTSSPSPDINPGGADEDASLHIRRTNRAATVFVESTDGGAAAFRAEASDTSPTQQARLDLANNQLEFRLINNGNRAQFFDVTNGIEVLTLRAITGRVGMGGVDTPSHPLEVGFDGTNGNGAHVTAAGVWTDTSTRTSKERIVDLDDEAAERALDQLNPVTYFMKGSAEDSEQYVGFIAEDVPDLVAMNGRKGIAAIEIAALVTKVVKQQRETIESQKETISSLVERVEKLEASKTVE